MFKISDKRFRKILSIDNFLLNIDICKELLSKNSQHNFTISINSSVQKHVRNRALLSRLLWNITMGNSVGFCWVINIANMTQQKRPLFTKTVVGFCGHHELESPNDYQTRKYVETKKKIAEKNMTPVFVF